jgi:hypothetical protein
VEKFPDKFPVLVNMLCGTKTIGTILVSDNVPEDEIWLVSVDEFGDPFIAGKITNIKKSSQPPSPVPPQEGPPDEVSNSE